MSAPCRGPTGCSRYSWNCGGDLSRARSTSTARIAPGGARAGRLLIEAGNDATHPIEVAGRARKSDFSDVAHAVEIAKRQVREDDVYIVVDDFPSEASSGIFRRFVGHARNGSIGADDHSLHRQSERIGGNDGDLPSRSCSISLEPNTRAHCYDAPCRLHS